MRKQCAIVGDLLPLYHDGVCSEESREMVDTHLAQCEDCRKMLGRIDGELVSPAAKDADLKPLKGITRTVKKGKRKALITGIALTLSVLLVIFLGWSAWWYVEEYSYYAAFAQGHLPMSIQELDENGNVLQSVVIDDQRYIWEDDTYRYTVIVPGFLSDNGYINMQRKDNSEDRLVDVAISKWDDTQYAFHISILHDGEENDHYFIVDKNLQNHKISDAISTDYEQLKLALDAHTEEAQKLIDDATAMWPFIE